MNIPVTASVQSVCHQHAHMISDGHTLVNCIVDVLVKVKSSLHPVFSQAVDVANLCFIHAYCITSLLSRFKAHEDPGPFR